MASSSFTNAFISFSLMLLFVSEASGAISCKSIEKSKCAYAVSSSGTRCVLEKQVRRGGREQYTCRSSEIEAGGLVDWIETDKCVEACGVDRNSLGISSDFLWDSDFTKKLCTDGCYKNCPNIVDLYFNLAAGEGVFLPKLCKKTSARRNMGEIVLASGPEAASSSETLLASSPTASFNLLAISPAAQ